MNNHDSLLEKLAELEHYQWWLWSSAICETEDISEVRRKKWEKLWVPYARLSEEEKEKDRAWARRVLEIINKTNMIFIILFSYSLYAEVPIKEFHQVNESIYRGARPTYQNMVLLYYLGIETILNIENDKKAIGIEKQWAYQLRMNYISYPLSGFFSPSKDKVDSIMQVLNNPYYWPIFIHCKHGQDRTGLIIGLYRVFYQEWTPKEAYQEMIRYGFHPWLLGLRFYYKKETGY